jgi:hypothetical protein
MEYSEGLNLGGFNGPGEFANSIHSCTENAKLGSFPHSCTGNAKLGSFPESL